MVSFIHFIQSTIVYFPFPVHCHISSHFLYTAISAVFFIKKHEIKNQFSIDLLLEPAISNRMGGLFSFQKEENPTITVESVIDGDINDSSTHYQVHKKAATAAWITFCVIAIIGCFWYYLQKARKDSAFTGTQRAARKKWQYLSLWRPTRRHLSLNHPHLQHWLPRCTLHRLPWCLLSQDHFQFVLKD